MNFVGKTNLFGGTLASQDPEIFNSLEKEFSRQQNEIELIASENIASPAVMEAQGSVMTNKYAEGYPGRRYYGGCENVDVAESNWQYPEPVNYTIANLLMYNRTREAKLTRQFFWL